MMSTTTFLRATFKCRMHSTKRRNTTRIIKIPIPCTYIFSWHYKENLIYSPYIKYIPNTPDFSQSSPISPDYSPISPDHSRFPSNSPDLPRSFPNFLYIVNPIDIYHQYVDIKLVLNRCTILPQNRSPNPYFVYSLVV